MDYLVMGLASAQTAGVEVSGGLSNANDHRKDYEYDEYPSPKATTAPSKFDGSEVAS